MSVNTNTRRTNVSDETHEENGFSHHCPKCNHHNPTLCLVTGQVKGLKKVTRDQGDEIARAWAALKVDPKEAADDPDTATLAQSIEVSLQYERDRLEMRDEQWKDASGLLAGGDPGGVTPEILREHQEMASDVVLAAKRFMDARTDDNASFTELREKLAAYLKRWPEQ